MLAVVGLEHCASLMTLLKCPLVPHAENASSRNLACGAVQELDDGHARVQDGLDEAPAGVVAPQQLHDGLQAHVKVSVQC